MGSMSMMHWVIVALVVLVLFGRGKISETMADFGKGLKSFRKGMADDEPADDAASRQRALDAPHVSAEQASVAPEERTRS